MSTSLDLNTQACATFVHWLPEFRVKKSIFMSISNSDCQRSRENDSAEGPNSKLGL